MILQIEPCRDMFVVNSDIMAHWFDMINTLVITNKFL